MKSLSRTEVVEDVLVNLENYVHLQTSAAEMQACATTTGTEWDINKTGQHAKKVARAKDTGLMIETQLQLRTMNSQSNASNIATREKQ